MNVTRIAVFVIASCTAVIAGAQSTIQEFNAAVSEPVCGDPAFRMLPSAEGKQIAQKSAEFEKLGFGGGYGAVVNLDDAARVEEAELVNGIVRVKKDNDVQFGPVLEMHKFTWALASQTLYKVGDDWVLIENLPEACRKSLDLPPQKRVPLIGAGPFVTVRVGGNEVVQSFGVGISFGFRKAESDNSLNIGIAYVSDPSVRTLGDGIMEGQPLPSGETQIRYKTTHQEGLMVLFSVGW